jgi:hypothetical protein
VRFLQPYFTLTAEARRRQREARHQMWSTEEYQNNRRMLRVCIWWCAAIVIGSIIAVAWRHL